jgi:hypothetical protein
MFLHYSDLADHPIYSKLVMIVLCIVVSCINYVSSIHFLYALKILALGEDLFCMAGRARGGRWILIIPSRPDTKFSANVHFDSLHLQAQNREPLP